MSDCKGNFVVRKATVDDIPHVRDMIQELADFEKMSDGPKLSTEDLVRDAGLNGQAGFMHCYIAECVDENSLRVPVGYAICFYSYSTWEGKSYFLEDIYVKPQYRKHGVGRLVFKYIAKVAKDNDCARLDFHVLDWNPAREFYEKHGAINLTSNEGWQFYRLNREQIDQLLEK